MFTDERERADVILMNTCAIRENAHNKVYKHLSELKKLKQQRPLVVGVLGCMAQNLKEELTDIQPLVDVLAGPDAYRRLPMLIRNAMLSQEEGLNQKGLAVDLSEYETYHDVVPDRNDGANAWIAVMRGCDNFCTTAWWRRAGAAWRGPVRSAWPPGRRAVRRRSVQRAASQA